jgi:hypothetical protein
MQVRCIRARAGVKVGDLAEVPDGAQVSDLYFEAVQPPAAPAPASPPVTPATVSPRGMTS